MIHKHSIQLWWKYVLNRGNTVYHKSEMVSWIQVHQPTANTNGIEREHRNCNEHGFINYVCIDKEDGWYKALPLRHTDKETAVLPDLEDIEFEMT